MSLTERTPRTRNLTEPGRERVRYRAVTRERSKYAPGGPGGGGRFIQSESARNQQTERQTASQRLRRTQASSYNDDDNNDEDEDEYLPFSNAISPTANFSRSRRQRTPLRPRQSSAATAAAAIVQSDGYKPREERGWEEFHHDLELDTELPLLSAADVDGKPRSRVAVSTLRDSPLRSVDSRASPENESSSNIATPHSTFLPKTELEEETPNQAPASSNITDSAMVTPVKRRPGRPPRRPESLLNSLGSSPAPKLTPLPSHNPRERLNLPKPSYRRVETFASFEQNKSVRVNFVDRTMAHFGYQESDMFLRPEKTLIRAVEGTAEEDVDATVAQKPDGTLSVNQVYFGRVEYDMDEQDDKWLEAYNAYRREEQVDAIKPAIFEITMTQIEKEWHALERRIPKPNPKPPQTHRPRSSSAAAVNGEQSAPGEEQDTKCAVCDDGDCENTNAIVFCDGCDLAVHQECYGVPFIPEGQWLCRKCQLVGRGAAACIFCPNTDGAFKQTNTLRWSHLLCAIWIPEVSLGNTTFMEPVMDVEKVPRQRWKLSCYICQQKMGACIQCGNRNCYAAFHVTCARRAKLFLKMKSTHGGPTTLDASVLKAFCDRHVPAEWRREHDVDRATSDAKEFYRNTMRGRRWTDSQRSALSALAQPTPAVDSPEDAHFDQSPNLSNKRKRNQIPSNVWRLPSGAPIIPHSVFTNVETFMMRFALRKRKEYVTEACKYWTLKREARRGAALLKRLQLQMENFTSPEVTRRNFAGMGAAGRPRLLRRIEFAETLERDMERIRHLCEKVREREESKLQDVYILRDILDTVYFPMTKVIRPIFGKAQSLDQKGVFAEGFSKIQTKLEQRAYTSVSIFSSDLSSVFGDAIGLHLVGNTLDLCQKLGGSLESHNALTSEQKEKKKLAKLIIKAIHVSLENAARKEAELGGRPYEKELLALDALLHGKFQDSHSISSMLDVKVVQDNESDDGSNSRFSSRFMPAANDERQQHFTSVVEFVEERSKNGTSNDSNGIKGFVEASMPATMNAEESTELHEGAKNHLKPENIAKLDRRRADEPPLKSSEINSAASGTSGGSSQAGFQHSNNNVIKPEIIQEPLTPPSSEKDLLAPLANGGIPWYFEPFDPVGTTIHDERWTGREVLRGMSEELSELDDEEVDGLMEVEKKKITKKKGVTDWRMLSLPLRETRAQKSRKLAAGIP